ncbi:phospholipase [Pararobbsia silviterrae]|uniref:Phospholipase n=2 Tax=Pararobbsia silviterrae TaxID=1792498 RepID=A0A494XT36_9BURK|nr:phospholipase [Pararobbsia silviterrae]
MFVLMMENRSYDNLLGWSDLRGWTPSGVATVADGLVGKPTIHVSDTHGRPYPVVQGAPFRLAFDPGHEFTDTLVQLCGADQARPYLGSIHDDAAVLPGGVYPPMAATPDATGFAYDLDAYGFDTATALRGFGPDQVPVLNFLAQQFAVCDRWFSSMPGPTWPNRFFALAGTSWGLDHSPSNEETIAATLFDGARFGNGSDSLLTRLTPAEWLVAHGDTPQSWALKGVQASSARFVTHEDLFSMLASQRVDANFIWIEPSYDPLGNFRNGQSMHPCGDVRNGEALIEAVYRAIVSSPYWEESVLLIVFDEHGGFFDHVIPQPGTVSGMPPLSPVAPTSLTRRGFRFDRFGVRVPAIIVSPYVKQATIDHTFYDHLSIAKTLARVTNRTSLPLLNTARFFSATDFSGVLTLSQPRKAADIHACPSALPVTLAARGPTINRSATAFANLGWSVQSGDPRA